MKILVTTLLIFVMYSLKAQTKVANYYIGKFGSNSYKRLSFWVKNGRISDVTYTFGQSDKESKLKYLGSRPMQDNPGFSVKFQNGYELNILPKGNKILVSDLTGKYQKTFSWEYEGPVNGRGTFCEPCAEDEKEAMVILTKNYIR